MNKEKCDYSGYGTFNFLFTVHKTFLLLSHCFNHVFSALLLAKYDEFLKFIIFHKQLLFLKQKSSLSSRGMSTQHCGREERTRGHLSKHARPHVCVSIPDYVIGRECRPTTENRGKRGCLK